MNESAVSLWNVECRTDLALFCNVCVKARPVWEMAEKLYCVCCLWRLDEATTRPERLPASAFERRETP